MKTPKHEASEHLSRKELARQFRHEAYLRAKEYRETDPRQIAMKAKIKEQRREAYQQAKKRNKAYRDEIKEAAKVKSARKRVLKKNKLVNMVVPGSTIKGRPHDRGTIDEPTSKGVDKRVGK